MPFVMGQRWCGATAETDDTLWRDINRTLRVKPVHHALMAYRKRSRA